MLGAVVRNVRRLVLIVFKYRYDAEDCKVGYLWKYRRLITKISYDPPALAGEADMERQNYTTEHRQKPEIL